MVVVLTGLILVCCFLLYRVLQLRRGSRTTGVVVAVRQDEFPGDTPIAHPTIRFTTSTGTTITAECTFSLPAPGTTYRIGQQVPVRYADHDPTFFTLGDAHLAGALFFLLLAVGSCVAICWGLLVN